MSKEVLNALKAIEAICQNALGEEEYNLVIDNDTGNAESLENIAKQLLTTSDGNQATGSTRHLVASISKLLCTMPTVDEPAAVHDSHHTVSSASPSAERDAFFENRQIVSIEEHREVLAEKESLHEELTNVTFEFKAYKEKHFWLVTQFELITAEHRKLKEEYTEKSAEDTTSLDVYESEDVRENSIDALKKQIDNLQLEKSELLSEVKTKDSQIDEVLRSYRTLTSERDTLQKQYDVALLSRPSDSLSDEVAHLKLEKYSYGELITRQKKYIDEVDTLVQGLRAEKLQIAETMKVTQKEINALKMDNAALIFEKSSHATVLAVKDAQIAQLKQEVEKLRSSMSPVVSSNGASTKSVSELNLSIATMLLEKISLQSQLDARTAEIDNLKKLLEISSIDLASNGEEIKDLKNTIASLRAELQTQLYHPTKSENSESVIRSIEKHHRSSPQSGSKAAEEYESKILNFGRPSVALSLEIAKETVVNKESPSRSPQYHHAICLDELSSSPRFRHHDLLTKADFTTHHAESSEERRTSIDSM